MLRSMAIRMKEWGMLAYPRQGVHLPVSALNDWGRSGRALGQGVAAAGTGVAELASAIKLVSDTGDEADIAGMLEEIARETTEELLESPVRDWDYSWKQAYTPRVQEMLRQFTGDAQERARKMSELYGSRYSLDGLRQLEVKRMRRAREHWQKQVDAAVQRGDSEAARLWMEQGTGVFVPESGLQQQLDKVQSRSLHAQWQQRMAQDPVAALTAWDDPAEQKPREPEDAQSLEQEVQQARAGAFSALALQLAAGVEQGADPAPEELERAAAAGVLSRELLESARQSRKPLSAADACNWLRRIDERAPEDDESLMVEIALAPVPVEERRMLMKRLQGSAQVPPQKRQAVSRRLWKMYHDGCFGNPGDAEALQCLGGLQEEALLRQTSTGADDCEQWLRQLQEEADAWVCYQPE